MGDLFISYARKDQEVVSKLAVALERQGGSVWWNRIIPAGINEGFASTGNPDEIDFRNLMCLRDGKVTIRGS